MQTRESPPSQIKLFVALLVLVAFLIAGCGDDPEPMTGPELAARLNAGCTKLAATLVQLPQRQADEDLSTAQVQSIAAAATKRLRERVELAQVSVEIGDTRQELLDALAAPAPTTAAELRVQTAQTGKLYQALGADRCKALSSADPSRRARSRLRSSQLPHRSHRGETPLI